MGHRRLTCFSLCQAVLCWSQGGPPSQCVGHDPREALHPNPSLAFHSKVPSLCQPYTHPPSLCCFELGVHSSHTRPCHPCAPRFLWALNNLANGIYMGLINIKRYSKERPWVLKYLKVPRLAHFILPYFWVRLKWLLQDFTTSQRNFFLGSPCTCYPQGSSFGPLLLADHCTLPALPINLPAQGGSARLLGNITETNLVSGYTK